MPRRVALKSFNNCACDHRDAPHCYRTLPDWHAYLDPLRTDVSISAVAMTGALRKVATLCVALTVQVFAALHILIITWSCCGEHGQLHISRSEGSLA